MRSFYSLLLGSLLLALLPLASANANGQNCAVDITTNVADDTDWRTVHVVRAGDGSLWQRAIVNRPESTLLIEEDGKYQIAGFAAADAEIQLFFAMPRKGIGERIQKPSLGTCFDAGKSDEFGFFQFEAHSRLLWQGMGQDMMIDAFYRMNSEEITYYENQSQDAGSYYATSYLPPRMVRIGLEQTSAQAVEEEANLLIQPQANTDFYAVDDPDAITTIVSDAFRDIDGSCQILCPTIPIYQSVTLKPWEIRSDLLGNNLLVSGGNEVAIGRAMNTYYVGIDGYTNILKKNTDHIALKALAMEMIKRMHGIDELTTPAMIMENARTNQGLEHARNLLTGQGDREGESLSLKRAANIPNNVQLDELFPAYASTPATWAEDFLQLVAFWTGNLAQNSCLILDNSRAYLNFLDGVEGAVTENLSSTAEQCHLVQTNGVTPLLLLHSDDPIHLQPAFRQTTIVASDKQFVDEEKYFFPAGTKSPLAYRYDFSGDFTSGRAGTMCVQKQRMPQLIDKIAATYSLSLAEKTVLAQELNAEFPQTKATDFVQLALAKPQDIAARFQWLANDKPLSLLQLFFEFKTGVCQAEQLTPPDLDFKATREGFEVGILR